MDKNTLKKVIALGAAGVFLTGGANLAQSNNVKNLDSGDKVSYTDSNELPGDTSPKPFDVVIDGSNAIDTGRDNLGPFRLAFSNGDDKKVIVYKTDGSKNVAVFSSEINFPIDNIESTHNSGVYADWNNANSNELRLSIPNYDENGQVFSLTWTHINDAGTVVAQNECGYYTFHLIDEQTKIPIPDATITFNNGDSYAETYYYDDAYCSYVRVGEYDVNVQADGYDDANFEIVVESYNNADSHSTSNETTVALSERDYSNSIRRR